MPMKKDTTGWIKTVTLAPPSLQDNTADADRLKKTLESRLNTDCVEIDFPLLKNLPDRLRECNYSIRCILFKDNKRWLLAGITAANDSTPVAGLAVDLGTTRVVVRIIDLSTGTIKAESSFDNPQITIGPDILARIHFADKDNGSDKLKELIINGLNGEIAMLCNETSIRPDQIYLLAVAGNTAMTHLFLGLNPRWIIREPYIPVTNTPGIVKAEELGIKVNPFARTFIFPNVGSYFGGDLIAGILYSGLNKMKDTAIMVDVGTNAEVVLGNENWLIACAGAAGPALEGGVTQMGMMAAPGVIDRISIDPQTHEFDIHTIAEKPPRGICGSGLIDLACHLFLSGMIDIRGKFKKSACKHLLKEIDEIRHLVIVPEEKSATGKALTISQADLDSLIRSKAAMYTILETITSSVGVSLSDLSKFYVAGTFGSFIKPKSAISIGMIPDLPIDRYEAIGNSSLGGATMVLQSSKYMDGIDKIRDKITYLELNVNQEFMNRFSAAKFLPHTDTSLFPSVVDQI